VEAKFQSFISRFNDITGICIAIFLPIGFLTTGLFFINHTGSVTASVFVWVGIWGLNIGTFLLSLYNRIKKLESKIEDQKKDS